MKLTAEEIAWVSGKLDGYDIKYQEIYDELKDHMLTAIEERRAQGDDRSVELVWADILAAQFPKWWPFEYIVKQYEAAYRKKIVKATRANFRYYLNWQTIPVVLLMTIAGLLLPHTKAVTVTMLITLLLVALVPQAYIYMAGRGIQTDKGKQSLVKNHVNRQGNFLILIINILLNLVAMIAREVDTIAFLNPMHYPPVIFMLMTGLFMIYGLGCMRMARQEFKIADL